MAPTATPKPRSAAILHRKIHDQCRQCRLTQGPSSTTHPIRLENSHKKRPNVYKLGDPSDKMLFQEETTNAASRSRLDTCYMGLKTRSDTELNMLKGSRKPTLRDWRKTKTREHHNKPTKNCAKTPVLVLKLNTVLFDELNIRLEAFQRTRFSFAKSSRTTPRKYRNPHKPPDRDTTELFTPRGRRLHHDQGYGRSRGHEGFSRRFCGLFLLHEPCFF